MCVCVRVSVCVCVCLTVCCISGYLGRAVLLFVWIPFSCLYHSNRGMLRGVYCHDVLSALCRGVYKHVYCICEFSLLELSLVVAYYDHIRLS